MGARRLTDVAATRFNADLDGVVVWHLLCLIVAIRFIGDFGAVAASTASPSASRSLCLPLRSHRRLRRLASPMPHLPS